MTRQLNCFNETWVNERMTQTISTCRLKWLWFLIVKLSANSTPVDARLCPPIMFPPLPSHAIERQRYLDLRIAINRSPSKVKSRSKLDDNWHRHGARGGQVGGINVKRRKCFKRNSICYTCDCQVNHGSCDADLD